MFVEERQGLISNIIPAKPVNDTKKHPMRIEGHRGAGHLEPENSLKAFNKAIELGIDGVEFDVRLCEL